jgi:hypothetical protein
VKQRPLYLVRQWDPAKRDCADTPQVEGAKRDITNQ